MELLENQFKKWNEVADYESDETTVTLLGKNKKILGNFTFYRFIESDFKRYKLKAVRDLKRKLKQ